VVRTAVSAFIVALPALILTRQWVEAVTGAGVGWFGAVEGTLVLGVVAVVIVVGAWARHRGLTWSETVRLLFGATTTSAGWSAPGLRRLLTPTHGGVRPPERDEPADYLRAIDEAVAHQEAPARAPAAAAAATARRLVTLLERCEAELRALSLGSGVSETDRIGAQLAALENTGYADEETQRLTALLRAQLEIVHRMRVRCEMLSAHRGRLLLLLHGLWTHLAALGGGLAPPAERTALERLDAARAEIDAELAAALAAITAQPQQR
jgi:hypothetical protein